MSAPTETAVDAESTAVFRLAVEVCPSGIIVVGADGVIRLVNAEIERLFGYSREELCGRSIDVLLPPALRNKHATERRHYGKRPHARHFGAARDFRACRRDGSEFPVEIGLNPIRVGDGVMVVAAVVDISERKRLERARDEFVATVSHELRTPMTAITASLGLLLADASNHPSQPAVHLLQIAHDNCRRLVRMLDDLLDLKKLEAGQMPFRFERCDGRTLLERAIETTRSLAVDRGVTIRLEAPADPVALYVDPDRLIQVVTNLLSNALKASPNGKDVLVTLEQRTPCLRIGVRDYGAGIPAEFRSRIFTSFAQPTGARKGGSGLGLSIAQKIVAGLHGRIGFEDAPGGGTVFYVELPDGDDMLRESGVAATA
jgi:PAS domain S-box-containing protein